MRVEILRTEQQEGVVELNRLDCGFYIIGWKQSNIYCLDEECKSRLDKVFKKLPSSIVGVAMYFSPHNPHETLAVINGEVGR